MKIPNCIQKIAIDVEKQLHNGWREQGKINLSSAKRTVWTVWTVLVSCWG